MANTYVEFSMEIEKLTIEEIAWWESYLAKGIEVEVESEDDCSRDLCSFTDNRTAIWIHSEEYGNISDLVDVFQRFLKDTGSDRIISFTWSDRCSKPLVGEFGGGVVIVSAKQCALMHTAEAEGRIWQAFKDGTKLEDLPFTEIASVSSD